MMTVQDHLDVIKLVYTNVFLHKLSRLMLSNLSKLLKLLMPNFVVVVKVFYLLEVVNYVKDFQAVQVTKIVNVVKHL